MALASSLPTNTPISEAFLKVNNVRRHSDGAWNSLTLEQFGEKQAYIRYRKAKGELVEKLCQEQVTEWPLFHRL